MSFSELYKNQLQCQILKEAMHRWMKNKGDEPSRRMMMTKKRKNVMFPNNPVNYKPNLSNSPNQIPRKKPYALLLTQGTSWIPTIVLLPGEPFGRLLPQGCGWYFGRLHIFWKPQGDPNNSDKKMTIHHHKCQGRSTPFSWK